MTPLPVGAGRGVIIPRPRADREEKRLTHGMRWSMAYNATSSLTSQSEKALRPGLLHLMLGRREKQRFALTTAKLTR